ncbi:MAG: helicase-exonuclease AddAB subunit AddA [Lachnospiraceae bacterium]|nr:helicase-exonuclease AddAB subunit AddA [Lachnospiraceae bacterium]
MDFTDEQKKVIDSRNKNLIVSAAAGSGKTAVLTERIVKKICEDENLSVDRMLIVTFTNSAAREMKERIGKKLRERLAENPDNAHLRKQIAILHTAQITTIDSFCLYILKNHFEEIGVDPSFAIGSEGEINQISDEAFDDDLEEAFKEGNEEFLNLVEMYAPKGKFRKFYELVKGIAAKADSSAYPYDTLQSFIVEDTENVWELPFVKFILEYENEFLREALRLYREVKEISEGSFLTKHLEEANFAISFIEDIIAGDMRRRIRKFPEFEKTTLNYGRKDRPAEETALKDSADKVIDEARKIIDKYKKKYKDLNETDFEESVKEGYAVTNSLLRFVMSYMRTFDAKKRDKNIISFSDMEHMALEILVKKEGDRLVPTPTAIRYREFFNEVMIDEYQDSNDVQETILAAVSKDEELTGNRFMVGDIKQSIYRFRLAKPDIFKEKCLEYSKEGDRDERIILSHNFRSRREVIDAVNFVFERCMIEKIGGVGYGKDERLNLGKKDYPSSNIDNKAELIYFNKKEFEENEQYADLSTDEIEAAIVAKRIRALKEAGTLVYDVKADSMREMKYSDVAILLRSMTNGRDVIFQKALKKEGIQGYVISKAGYYSAWEVQLILNFLSVIDNPRQDMPLLSVMHSFIGSFSEEEIAKVRVIDKKKRLIDSLYRYILEGSDSVLKEKVLSFTAELEELRKQAMYTSASDMLRMIFEKYEYAVMVSSLPGGEQRLANVNLLVETADEYEEQGIYCIHDFVKYTEKLKAKQDMGEANMLDENADVVQILTVHKSKGLEYPICFVSGLHTKFRYSSDTILMDDELGIGGDTFNLEKRIKGTSPVREAIYAKEKVNSLGEEIRVLYVAMTRAREKLILTGMLEEEIEAKDKLSFANIMDSASFMKLIFPIISESPELFEVKKVNPGDEEIKEVFDEAERISKRDALSKIPAKPGFEEFVYPYESLDNLFVKTTVSELKKAAYLEQEDGENTLYHEEEVRVPKIISDTEIENGGAARGSAYHRVMELMDFEHIYEGDIAANLRAHRQKMTDNLFIYEEDDALVSEDKILKFLDTDLAKRMSEAAKKEKLYLEQPFVLSVPANEVNESFPNTEKVLVQGVIDVYFEEDGKLILMDYKTDRVDTAEELIKRYKTQLDYYSEALSRLEKKPVAEVLIYSFALGEVITV